MRMDYDPKLFYAKTTFNFNEDGKAELISNNQTEDLLILIFQEIRHQNYLLEKNKKYLSYIVILFCLNLFVLSLIFYAISLFLKI